jgi:RNA polymerase sigma-70 factor (ECF subfamily)
MASVTDQRRSRLVAALGEVARGDRAALRETYDLTSAKLLGVILRITRDRETAEDVLQECYVKVWNRAGRFDPSRASPITWLCVIARNTAISQMRKTGRRDEVAGPELPEVADDAPDAETFLCHAQDRAALRNCMDELQDDHRRAIRLAFFDGLSHSQLASKVGVPLGTIKSWIRRGLTGLKGCLGG